MTNDHSPRLLLLGALGILVPHLVAGVPCVSLLSSPIRCNESTAASCEPVQGGNDPVMPPERRPGQYLRPEHVPQALLVPAGLDPDLASTQGRPDEMYDPTPLPVVAQMLDLLHVGQGDVLIDLGCGDGRIPIAAAQRGARAIGVDIDPQRIAESRANAAAAGVTVEWRTENLFVTDLAGVTAVTLYLSPRINQRLWPKLQREAPHARVASYAYESSVPPSRTVTAVVRDPGGTPDRDVLLLWDHP